MKRGYIFKCHQGIDHSAILQPKYDKVCGADVQISHEIDVSSEMVREEFARFQSEKKVRRRRRCRLC